MAVFTSTKDVGCDDGGVTSGFKYLQEFLQVPKSVKKPNVLSYCNCIIPLSTFMSHAHVHVSRDSCVSHFPPIRIPIFHLSRAEIPRLGRMHCVTHIYLTLYCYNLKAVYTERTAIPYTVLHELGFLQACRVPSSTSPCRSAPLYTGSLYTGTLPVHVQCIQESVAHRLRKPIRPRARPLPPLPPRLPRPA